MNDAMKALIKDLKDRLQSATVQPACCGMGIDDGMSAPHCCGEPEFDWPDDVAELLNRADAALEQKAEPVAWRWEYFGMHVTTDYDRAKQMIADGVDLQPLYTTPPSSAEQWKPSGAEYDRNIHNNPDAAAWADFFMATFPNCGADRDTMLGWFANAMMAVHDSMPSTAEVEARALERLKKDIEAEYWPSEAKEGVAQAIEYIVDAASEIREQSND